MEEAKAKPHIRARDGSERPIFLAHTGKVCCAVACQKEDCRSDFLPCMKPLRMPYDSDVGSVHRCSKRHEYD